MVSPQDLKKPVSFFVPRYLKKTNETTNNVSLIIFNLHFAICGRVCLDYR